jgi:hypothetical protein
MQGMDADKRSLPAYARRGVLLDPAWELLEKILEEPPAAWNSRTFFQILRQDLLPVLPWRKRKRKKR